MRKLFLFITALTLSAGLWADDLEVAKDAAITAIESAAETAKAEIDAASKYPAADAIKAEYNNKVNDAVATAKTAINAATTIAEVDEQQSIYTLKIDVIVAEAEAAIAPIDALEEHREKVIGEIEKARQQVPLPELDEEQKGYVNETIDDAVNAVNAATTTTQMDRAEAKIFFILSMYPAGKAAGIEEGKAAAKAELLGAMGEPCTGCTAVEVTKGDKTVTLYAPESVNYILMRLP